MFILKVGSSLRKDILFLICASFPTGWSTLLNACKIGLFLYFVVSFKHMSVILLEHSQQFHHFSSNFVSCTCRQSVQIGNNHLQGTGQIYYEPDEADDIDDEDPDDDLDI